MVEKWDWMKEIEKGLMKYIKQFFVFTWFVRMIDKILRAVLKGQKRKKCH